MHILLHTCHMHILYNWNLRGAVGPDCLVTNMLNVFDSDHNSCDVCHVFQLDG